MMLFEKTFWTQVNEFIDFQQKKNKAANKPWHRQIAKGPDAFNQHQVADRYKGRYTGDGEFTYSGELNDKIESIRNGDSTWRPLTDLDLKHIMSNYTVKDIPKDKPKRIFSGVVALWSPEKDCYIIQRDSKAEDE